MVQLERFSCWLARGRQSIRQQEAVGQRAIKWRASQDGTGLSEDMQVSGRRPGKVEEVWQHGRHTRKDVQLTEPMRSHGRKATVRHDGKGSGKNTQESQGDEAERPVSSGR